jgi:uncharacterized repeat protein (TIGR03803 family)
VTQEEICSRLSRATAVSLLTLLLAASAAAAGHDKVLHTFLGKPGKHPYSSLISDLAGNLYGTTSEGGSRACTGGDGGCGVAFKLTPGATGWSYSVLYVFKGGRDGVDPNGSLIFDASGNLYGTTASGGGSQSCASGGCGTVFELSPTSGSGWTESVLYRFQGEGDGQSPQGGVVFDRAGNLYGATVNGGTGCNFSCGTVFELSPVSGGGWIETILYNFQGADGNPDGAYPEAGVTIDASGNLYGTTTGGGAGPCAVNGGCGTVFEVSPGSSGWTESVLHRFRGGADGQGSYGSVASDSSGNLYGTTLGGNASCGTVFELTPSGGHWRETVLHRFACGRDGGVPSTGVTFDAASNIYGTTQTAGVGYGTIYKLASNPGGKRKFSVLHSFTGAKDGATPEGSLIFDPIASQLFGTAYYGGDAPNFSGFGVVFEITP